MTEIYSGPKEDYTKEQVNKAATAFALTAAMPAMGAAHLMMFLRKGKIKRKKRVKQAGLIDV